MDSTKALILAVVGLLLVATTVGLLLLRQPEPGRPNLVDLVIDDGLVLTMDPDRRVIEHGAVAIQGDKIVAVGPRDDVLREYRGRRSYGAGDRLIMPGLINAGARLSETVFRGIADDLPGDLLRQRVLNPAELVYLDRETAHESTLLGAVELIRGGTTTVATVDPLADEVAMALRTVGLRAQVAIRVRDEPGPEARSPAEALSYAEAFVNKWRNDPLVAPAVAAENPLTVSPDLYRELKRLANRANTAFVTAVGESPDEPAQVQARYGRSAVAHLADLGVLDQRTLLLHAAGISADDLELLRTNQVAVAHTPSSDLRRARTSAPVPALLANRLRVGLGSDGAAHVNRLDLLDEVREAAKLHKLENGDPTGFTAQTAVELATIGAARTLGLDRLIGSLEVGKRADIVLLDLGQPEYTPRSDPYSLLAYNASSRDVRVVLVGGRFLLEDGRLQTIDENLVMRYGREAGQRIRPANLTII